MSDDSPGALALESRLSELESRLSASEWRLQELGAIEAIRRLIAELVHGFSKRDMPRFLAVWHPEGSWLDGGYEAVGHDGLRAFAEQSWAGMKTIAHYTSNEVIEVAGDRGTGTIDVTTWVQTKGGEWHQGVATYNDSYVRLDGTWVFERRTTSIHAILSHGAVPAHHPWGDITD